MNNIFIELEQKEWAEEEEKKQAGDACKKGM
jgi:hypothetical protein